MGIVFVPASVVVAVVEEEAGVIIRIIVWVDIYMLISRYLYLYNLQESVIVRLALLAH